MEDKQKYLEDSYIMEQKIIPQIEVDIDLNEELTVTINNNKEEKPVFEKIEKEKSVRKLPITGM